jgi:hypothetical protein
MDTIKGEIYEVNMTMQNIQNDMENLRKKNQTEIPHL